MQGCYNQLWQRNWRVFVEKIIRHISFLSLATILNWTTQFPKQSIWHHVQDCISYVLVNCVWHSFLALELLSWHGSRPSVHPFTFSRLRDKLHILSPILLKFVQIICIIVKIYPIENEDNPSNIMENGPFWNSGYCFSSLRDKVHIFYSILLKLAENVYVTVKIDLIENENNSPIIVEKELF